MLDQSEYYYEEINYSNISVLLLVNIIASVDKKKLIGAKSNFCLCLVSIEPKAYKDIRAKHNAPRQVVHKSN